MMCFAVAICVGAWNEKVLINLLWRRIVVAIYVGAWSENYDNMLAKIASAVATCYLHVMKGAQRSGRRYLRFCCNLHKYNQCIKIKRESLNGFLSLHTKWYLAVSDMYPLYWTNR